jgi:hypothetical protein
MVKPFKSLDEANAKLPICLVGDTVLDSCLGQPTAQDLYFACLTEIDLTVEGQDGTSRRNLRPLKNYLARLKVSPLDFGGMKLDDEY